MNEQLAAIKEQAEGGHLDVMVVPKADVLAMLAEVERLTGELARLRNGGKPEPSQEENDAAAARIKRIDELYTRYSLGGCYDVDEWPEYAQSEYERLDKAQREYEARYC